MISLIVHGGAWDIPASDIDAHRRGCLNALMTGWKILQSAGSACDAVEAAIRSMEDDETFDAGYGSHLNMHGQVELDASIMNGKPIRCGAVAAVHKIRNPISVARKIMDESEHILLVGGGAEQFALEHKIELCEPDSLINRRERERWKQIQDKQGFKTIDSFRNQDHSSDTVGAVALDDKGIICAGTSTGGTLNKYPGRVGDSPLIGSGTYADTEIGGVSTTGWGEAMIKVVMAKTVIDIMEANGGNVQEAADRGIEILRKKANGYGGLIVLNHLGEPGVSYNTPKMARAYINSKMTEAFASV